MQSPIRTSAPSNFRGPRRHRRDAESDHPDWKTYTFVKVHVRNLPANVTTLQVYFNLRRFGNINSITLHDTRAGYRSSTAEVIFKPPPIDKPPWRYNGGTGIPFNLTSGPRTVQTKIFATFHDEQRKNFIFSDTVSGSEYNEESTIPLQSLQFGVLKSAFEMNVMSTVHSSPENSLELVLNLKKKEMDLRFPIFLQSSNAARMRSYKFHIALDETFRIFRKINDDDSTTFIINVNHPPWYSRRREDKISASHIPDAKRWREDDLWVRQTDIVQHKEVFAMIDQTPISLRKNLNLINVARWTTFAMNVSKTAEAEEACLLFAKALEDSCNNRVFDASEFVINRHHHDSVAKYWQLLDQGNPTKSNLALDLNAFDLSFEIRYQLEVCISHGWLSEYEVTEEFLRRLDTTTEHQAKQILVHVAAYAQRVFDPMDIFSDIRYHKPVKARQIPSNCIEVYHATVTATGLLLDTPSVEISNRVVRRYRHYENRFLRVRFEDDDYRGQTKLFSSNNGSMILVFDRVKRAMKYGVIVAGRKYDFLAWGNSQLRDHGCYFFSAVDGGPSASSIRAEMGAFDNEKVVAKRAARMGQCFSTTQPIHLRIKAITRENTIPDIVRGQYTFSDGVGKISQLAARLVQANLKIPGELPSCFQFRMGGCKGVLAIDPLLKGIEVQVRASQFKFDSTSQELEIIRHSEFWQPFLNRQLILVLSSLGVVDQVFIEMQKTTMAVLQRAMKDEIVAMKALRDQVDPNRMTLAICDLVSDGFQRAREPFVMSLLYLWRAWSLKYLKDKAKIPISKGAFVLGTVDETGILRGHFDNLVPPPEMPHEEQEKTLPEIFLQITDQQTGRIRVIEGVCILARNPSLHKGDIRVVKAVDIQELHHMVDCVVMPQTGDRDLPNMCSGGDLDGDDYVVSWDERLLPKIWNAAPFHYDPPPPKKAAGEFTIDLMIDFFCDYLQNDFLGRIAHAHLGAADYLANGIESQECLELLGLHSRAVDYPKTGVPANLPRRLERTEWPHFMEKRGKSYHSHKVLGKLYDAVKLQDFKPCYEHDFDARILHSMATREETRQQARFLKHEYDIALRRIMVQHKIHTEFEVWSTFVITHSKAARDYKFHEEIGQLSRALKEQFYQALVEIAGGNTFDHLKELAVAAYQITAAELRAIAVVRDECDSIAEKPEFPFISFPWILADTLGRVAASATVSQLERSKPDIANVLTASDVRAKVSEEPHASSDDSLSLASKGSDFSDSREKENDQNAEEVPQSHNSDIEKDPFMRLDPFKVVIKKSAGSSQTARHNSTNGDESLVHVSQNSSVVDSRVESLPDSSQVGGMFGDPRNMTPEQVRAAFGADDDEGL